MDTDATLTWRHFTAAANTYPTPGITSTQPASTTSLQLTNHRSTSSSKSNLETHHKRERWKGGGVGVGEGEEESDEREREDKKNTNTRASGERERNRHRAASNSASHKAYTPCCFIAASSSSSLSPFSTRKVISDGKREIDWVWERFFQVSVSRASRFSLSSRRCFSAHIDTLTSASCRMLCSERDLLMARMLPGRH